MGPQSKVPDFKLKIDTIGAKKLYHKLPVMVDRLLSVRLMTAMEIGGSIFHQNIKFHINNCISKFHDFEQQYENIKSQDSIIQYLLPYITSGNIRYYITRDCLLKKNFDINKCNMHHIFPQSGFKVSHNKILYKYGSARNEFVKFYPIYTRTNAHCLKGSDDTINLKALTIDRHVGLNMRYDSKMLPHHQLLAELDYIESDLMDKRKTDCSVLSELYELLNQGNIEDLYKDDSYISEC